MSVQDYLAQIRKNTLSGSDRTASLDKTIKNLVNFEALKRATQAGVDASTKQSMQKLNALSEKILTTNEATFTEMQTVSMLLREFFSLIKEDKTASKVTVDADKLIQALSNVLDKFGDTLPEKFQNRVKYDIIDTAGKAGADKQQIYQQLYVTQVNQTQITQNILNTLVEQNMKVEREAEADKPKKLEEQRNTADFWKTKVGKILGFLENMVKGMGGLLVIPAILYGLMQVFKALPEKWKNLWRLFSGAWLVTKVSKGIEALKAGFTASRALKAGEAIATTTQVGKALKVGSTAADISKESKIAYNFYKGLKNWMDPKAARGIAAQVSKVLKFFTGVGKSISKLATPLSKMLNFFSKIGRAAMSFMKVGGVVAKAIPVVGWLITAASTIFDFVQGFNQTTGSMTDKIMGGLNNVIVKFMEALAMIPQLIGKAVYGLFKMIIQSVKTLFTDPKAFMTGPLVTMIKSIAHGIVNIITMLPRTIMSEAFKDLTDKQKGGWFGKALSKSIGFMDKMSGVKEGSSIEGPSGDGVRFGGPIAWGAGAVRKGMNSDFMKRFNAAAAEYYSATGKKVKVTSAFRSPLKQAQLWVRANIFHEKGIYSPAKPITDQTVAWGGKTFFVKGSGRRGPGHMTGQAIDVDPSMAGSFEKYARKHGIGRPFSWDPPHFQLLSQVASTRGSNETVGADQQFADPNSMTGGFGSDGTDSSTTAEASSFSPEEQAILTQAQSEQSSLMNRIKVAKQQGSGSSVVASSGTSGVSAAGGSNIPSFGKKSDVVDTALALLQTTGIGA